MMSADEAGFAIIFSAHQVAVDDDGGEKLLGDDVGGVGAVDGHVLKVWIEGYGL